MSHTHTHYTVEIVGAARSSSTALQCLPMKHWRLLLTVINTGDYFKKAARVGGNEMRRSNTDVQVVM
jgi:hypothetical protein